jgi:pimeloyl-ACP methyl ester carboxylesterase
VLAYEEVGRGKPVIFLHGFMESKSMWRSLQLSAQPMRCIFIDLPGHGESQLYDENEKPSIQYFAAKVRSFISWLKIDQYDIVGHSMGGYVALELKKTDANCQKVVLLNSNFWEDSEQKKRDRVRVADLVFKAKNLFVSEAIPGLFFSKKGKEVEIQGLIDEAKNMSADAIAYAALAMRERNNLSSILKKYPSDFLLISGQHDPLISPEEMRSRLPSEQLQVQFLENAGHMAHIEASEETKELICHFVK